MPLSCVGSKIQLLPLQTIVFFNQLYAFMEGDTKFININKAATRVQEVYFYPVQLVLILGKIECTCMILYLHKNMIPNVS